MYHKNQTKGSQKRLIRFPKDPQHFVFAVKATKQTKRKNQIKQQQQETQMQRLQI